MDGQNELEIDNAWKFQKQENHETLINFFTCVFYEPDRQNT